MRLKFRAVAIMILVLGGAWTCGGPAIAGQSQELLPEQSAAKAKQVLQQVITALGGQAYLNVRDSECAGRIWQPVPVGSRPDTTDFRDLWLLPDKNRTEYAVKREQTILQFMMGSEEARFAPGSATVVVFAGSGGWILDSKKHVENQPEDLVSAFNEQVKSDMNNMLRKRMNEPGVDVQYGGTDIIDLREAEWIEFTDSDRREMRLGIDQHTHLPLRWVVATRNPDTRERTEVIMSYTQYMALDGVKTPLSLELSRNDHKLSQTFLTECKYNSSLDPQLFTRAALEQRAAEVTKKGSKDSKSTK